MSIGNLLLALRRNCGDQLRTFFVSYFNPPGAARSLISQPGVFETAYVRLIRQVVEAHLDEANFTVSALCHECHISQPQLYRRLTALSGLSPVRFIHAIRLRKARELLRQSELTVAEIAYETGFSSPAYFTRLFVKTFSMTPSEYRKNGDFGVDE